MRNVYQGDANKCLVLCDQQLKTQNIHSDIKQRKAANPQTEQANVWY